VECLGDPLAVDSVVKLFFIDKKIKQDKMLTEMKQYQGNEKYYKKGLSLSLNM